MLVNLNKPLHCIVASVITDVLSAPNTIIVMWSAPPYTNYCVNINRTTLDSTETVVFDSKSVCGLANEYIFMYSNPSLCDSFSFTITPTEGEMRGTTSEPDTGFFRTVRGHYVIIIICIVRVFSCLYPVYIYISCII